MEVRDYEHEVMMKRPSIFAVNDANDVVAAAAAAPDPEELWGPLWIAGETACLFGGSNSGKSVLAVMVARRLAKNGKKVIFFDFELSDKQFQQRLVNAETGEAVKLPEGFLRANILPDRYDPSRFERDVLMFIEAEIYRHKADAIIVDNLTYLCSASENGDCASRLMMALCDIKRRLGISMLIVAHTPKRDTSLPLTQDDLAGSKKLANFFDSIVALGQSAADHDLRYVKQLKSRSTAIVYGEHNVSVHMLEHGSEGLVLDFVGTEEESLHLETKAMKYTADPERAVDVVGQLYHIGKTVKEIVEATGYSQAKVYRIIAKIKQCTPPLAMPTTDDNRDAR